MAQHPFVADTPSASTHPLAKAARRRPIRHRHLLRATAIGLLLSVPLQPAFSTDTSEIPTVDDGASTHRLRLFMERQRSLATSNGRGVTELTPERQQERSELLRAGEEALGRRDVAAALEAFERATYMLHGIDTDASLARTYMQSGQYQRALALGSHMAGVHTDVEGGSVLYIWLLHLGGQSATAKRLLQLTHERWPEHALLDLVKQQLGQSDPLATGPLLKPPIRLAPYGDSAHLPASARVVGTATLLRNGTTVLVPAALLSRTSQMWLRNGLGQLAQAQPGWRPVGPHLALVPLATALPVAEYQGVAPDDPLPGSRALTVEYVPSSDAHPAWPVMRVGTLGEVLAMTGGGPLFDTNGRLTGIALGEGAGRPHHWLGASQLQSALAALDGASQPQPFGPVTDIDPRGRDALAQVYERSLRTSLQVIAVAPP